MTDFPAFILAQDPGAGENLLQYGALGAVALIAIGALFKILSWASHRTAGELERIQQELAIVRDRHQQEIQHLRERHREEIAHERARSDRFESELRELNRTVADRVVPAVVKATDVLESSFRRRDDR